MAIIRSKAITTTYGTAGTTLTPTLPSRCDFAILLWVWERAVVRRALYCTIVETCFSYLVSSMVHSITGLEEQWCNVQIVNEIFCTLYLYCIIQLLSSLVWKSTDQRSKVKHVQHAIKYDSLAGHGEVYSEVYCAALFCAIPCCFIQLRAVFVQWAYMVLSTLSFGSSASVWCCSESYHMVFYHMVWCMLNPIIWYDMVYGIW